MRDWRMRISSLRCEEVCAGLAHLGFEIKNGKCPGHKVVSHSALRGFIGTNFNCGHGRNDVVKIAYIKKLLRVLSENQPELEQRENSHE